MKMKAILVVSFGTTYVETRKKNIEHIENAIAEAFPEYDVFRAFTSEIVMRRIRKNEGIEIFNVKDQLANLLEKGYQEILIQTLHIIPGLEYEKILKAVEMYKDKFEVIKVGKPLLYTYEDYVKVCEILKAEIGSDLAEDEALILMGHGSDYPIFTAYPTLDYMLEGTPIFVGAVESYPYLEDILPKVKAAGYKKAYLHALMLVAGDHAQNDMASDEEDSWKTILEKEGFSTRVCLKGLGEYTGIVDMFIEHLQEV